MCDSSGSSGTVHFVSVMTKKHEKRSSFLSLQVDCRVITKVFSLKGSIQEGLCKMSKSIRVPVEN